mgnify:CR=1 FL=1
MNNFDKITLVSAKSLLERKDLEGLVREGEKTELLGEVFDATQELYNYLLEKDATLGRAQELIERKNSASDKFRKATGLTWRL